MRSWQKVIYSATCGFVAVFLLWILADENSPLVKHFAPSPVPFRDVWAGLHFHIYLVMVAFNIPDGGGHLFFYSAVFAQWFLIGYILSWLWSRRKQISTKNLN